MPFVHPIYKGFNLLYFFTDKSDMSPQAWDYDALKEWGFNFVRLPMSYRLWASAEKPLEMNEAVLKKVDLAVSLGLSRNLHVNLNLHRAPGYCVNPPVEPLSLWRDESAIEAFARTWEVLAKRYKNAPTGKLSFNLVNEPGAVGQDGLTEETYVRAMERAIEAIQAVSPKRMIIADGLSWGNEPVQGLIKSGVGQSCRGYIPFGVSHYKASWAPCPECPEPTWPGGWHFGEFYNAEKLALHYQKWGDLKKKGTWVHCGECGAYNKTPSAVFHAWLSDLIRVLDNLEIGWALWNFRGSFGPLDSERSDLKYAEYKGHLLDAKMLEILRKSARAGD